MTYESIKKHKNEEVTNKALREAMINTLRYVLMTLLVFFVILFVGHKQQTNITISKILALRMDYPKLQSMRSCRIKRDLCGSVLRGD